MPFRNDGILPPGKFMLGFQLPYIKKEVCLAINELAQVENINGGTEPPYSSMLFPVIDSSWIGSSAYTRGYEFTASATEPMLLNKRDFCFRYTNNQHYTYVHIPY